MYNLSMKEDTGRKDAALRQALDLVGDRWTALIMWQLRDGPKRFTDLQGLCGINTKTLSQRLVTIEEAGMITKEVIHEFPPRTMYSMTDRGTALLPAFNTMMEWVQKYY
jgi:DNA-binding HxlR family transcriptional regulator